MERKIGQLKNFGLFVFALLHVIFFHRKNKIQDPKVVCIIQLAKLGDMVCTTPIFRAVKNKFPDSRVIVVGDSVNEALLSGSPDVNKYIVSDRKDIFSVAHQLRRERVDFCCITGPNFVSLLMSIFAGISSIAVLTVDNVHANQTRTFRLLQRFVFTVPYTYGDYVSRAHLDLLQPIDIVSDDTTKHLYYTAEAEGTINAFLSSHGITRTDLVIGISPTAGHRTKEWPTDRFAKVADYISKKCGAKIIIIGGPTDKKEGDAIVASLNKETPYVNTVAQLNIEELKALIAKLDLFISVDTGPIYIAEAFGVATIDIAGPIDVNEQPPRGKLHRNVVPRSGKKLLFAMNVRNYDYNEVRKEVESITPEMVIEAFEQLYPLIKEKQP